MEYHEFHFCLALCCIVESLRILPCICIAQVPCLVTFVLFAPRFVHMSSMSA